MCISRVGRVLSIREGKARVRLLGDNRIVDSIDVSMINAKAGSFVEVFANIALSIVSAKDAKKREASWLAVMSVRG